MRELTLSETSYLAGGLLLCLVLPLLTSIRAPVESATRRFCLKIVWTGQTLLAIAGLTVLVSPLFAPYAAMFGFASCIACALALHRRLRVAPTA